MFFFIPKLQFFKSLSKISVYDILTNNFKVDVKQNLKPEYCVPVKNYFDEISFYYEITNYDYQTTVHRYNSWSDRFIILILLFDLLRALIYLIWMEEDQVIRMYGGNLEVFFGFNTKYMTIPQIGVTLSAITIFCLYQYSSLSHLNWLKVFYPIEGRQSFVGMKIFMEKSAKKLIRFTLILISIASAFTNSTPILVCFFFMFFSFVNITLKQFILCAFPWALMSAVWVLLVCANYFASLIILIICYYYEIRLDQLDVYVNLYLKRKRFNRINQQISNLLCEYTEVINKINDFNKFSSKITFYLLLCCSSTQIFLIYNMIYVKIGWLLYLLYILFSWNVCLVIVVNVLSTIRISRKFQRNKQNLVKLSFVKNMAIRNRFKVSLILIIF